ncbi:S8 family serine peptidase [Rossellomorea vietnamensis]|uniref:S8 family serine peptidase n=1 Tax=Rossellomorea vietnamensis TaxID=218284 RepID=A0A5D4KGK5_9BACI|nr:S8 family serine peptidase [Rossellomorea vietnamensis]TYR76009.1 S8 family serine peptidase [Rossellomorea vietnamensis]
MKKFILISAALIGMLLPSIASASAVSGETSLEETQRIILGFQKETDLSLLEGVEYSLHYIYEEINAISITVPVTEVSRLKKSDAVKWVEPDIVVQTNGQVVDWGHEATNRPAGKDLGLTGEGVKVAVLDSGISKSHPDLKVAGGVSFVEGINSYHDDNGHGTHVAGIIAAQDNGFGTVGVAPGVELYAVKALDEEGFGLQSDVVAGINWAIKNEMDIINLSITSPISSISLKEVIKKTTDEGILVTAASGNDETGTGQIGNDIMFPARYPGVIGVGAINEKLKHSAFSYTGASLMFSAPGDRVYSTTVLEGGKVDGYTYMSGTSMATPYMAGVLALYKEIYPSLTFNQIEQILSGNVIDLGAKGRDPLYGYGLIQAPISLFWDVRTGIWYTDSITYLSREKFISGYKDGSFRPDNFITREEAVAMIGRAVNLDGAQRTTTYPDVLKEYFGSGYIASATASHIIAGYPDQTFKPKQSITRGDVAVIIQNAFELPLMEGASFDDVKGKKYYSDEINTLKAHTILTGYPDNTFKPDQHITRAEFSIILSKVVKEP